jgi:tripartite-type tricarboxylate transporter receptor subunit TctC
MIDRRALLLAAAALASAEVRAQSQGWPARPIRIVIPFGPGAASDMVARRLGERLQAALGQPVVVENKAGASGQIAAEFVAKSAADGYTFLLTSNTTHSANPFLFKKLSYDPVADFTPICRVCAFPFVLVVASQLPAGGVKELVAHAQKAGNTSYGYGNSTGQIAGAALNRLMRMDSVGVPYKSVPQVVTDLLGGQISWAFIDMTNAFPHMTSGKLRALAVSSEVRSALTPDLPTITEETGLQGFDLTAWGALFGPAGVPRPIVDRLAAEVTRITSQGEFRERLRTAGVEVQQSTPDELRTFVDKQLLVWGKKVRDAQIQPE